MFSSIRQHYQILMDLSNVTKMHFWMIQRAKTEFFSQFLDFGLLDRLDIAYCDRTKCFPTFGNIAMSWKIIQKSEKCIFDWFKVPKKCFLTTFWTLVCWIDLIFQILILQKVFKHFATSPRNERWFKNHENAVLKGPKCQKRVFCPFSRVCWIDLILPILLKLQVVWQVVIFLQGLWR